MVIGDVLALVSVSCEPLPALPIVAGPKSISNGEMLRSDESRPIPNKLIFAGDPVPENGSTRLPENNPFPLGLNTTLTRQLAPAAKTFPQVLAIEKGPDTDGFPMSTDAGVVLNSVTILGMPATPGFWPPKLRF